MAVEVKTNTQAGGDPYNWGVGVGHYVLVHSYRHEQWAIKAAVIIREALNQAIREGKLTEVPHADR